MFQIQLTIWDKSHIWKEGGWFTNKYSAEYQAKQIRKMRRYQKVKVVKMK